MYIMEDLHPLSDLVNQLQELTGKESKLVGSYFKNEYTSHSDPEEMRNQVSFAGGDVQTAYSNLKSAYDIGRKANSQNNNGYKISGDKDRNLNSEVVSGNMRNAEEQLESAINRLKNFEKELIEQLIEQLINIKSKIQEHREVVENTGMVVFK